MQILAMVAHLSLYGVKRRSLHDNSWIQDLLDLTITNDDICNCGKVVLFSIYQRLMPLFASDRIVEIVIL